MLTLNKAIIGMLINKLTIKQPCLLGGFPQTHFVFSGDLRKSIKFSPGDCTGSI